MEKFCVFCGNNPECKTMEHIIPMWLLKKTGDPKRKGRFGMDWHLERERIFSFDQLKFPACSNCNNYFSQLEEKTRYIIDDVLNEKPINAKSFDILLSWFDKIRIGLWLGFYYLDKNIFGIKPNFYIERRINAKDRLLLIYKSFEKQDGLNIFGVDFPFFGHQPSCFGLVINQFYFVNVSSDYLFSRRLGLPFPKVKKRLRNFPGFYAEIEKGLEKILIPLLRISYDSSCREIYQPIIPKEFSELNNMYNTNYVKKYFKSSRIGKVLIKKSLKKIVEYPKNKSKLWIPKTSNSRMKMFYIGMKTVLNLQNYLLNDCPSPEDLSIEEQKRHKKDIRGIKSVNNRILKLIIKDEKKHII